MNELIVQENNTGVIKSDIANELREILLAKKTISEREEEIKSQLLKEMTLKDIIKIENEIEGIEITRILPTERETFNSKRLKEDNPDLYDEYITMTPVKSSLRLKVK